MVIGTITLVIVALIAYVIGKIVLRIMGLDDSHTPTYLAGVAGIMVILIVTIISLMISLLGEAVLNIIE